MKEYASLSEHPCLDKINKRGEYHEYIFSFHHGMYKESARIYIPKERIEDGSLDFFYRKMCEERIVTFEKYNIMNLEDSWFKELYLKAQEEYQKPFRIRKMFKEFQNK